MSWPTVAVITTSLDAGTDSPATARSHLLDMAQKVNVMIAGRNIANGVAPLGADGKVPVSNITVNTALGLLQLDGSGKAAVAQLPVAVANGVCDLDSSTKVPIARIPTDNPLIRPVPRIKAFTTAGADSWVIPTGVNYVVAIVAGGGGSGGTLASGRHGGGGGAGGVAIKGFEVVPGETISVVVGDKGAEQTSGASDGFDGGDSTLVYDSATVTDQALTGGGGKKGSSGATPFAEGAGGTATGGDINIGGGQGGNGTTVIGGIGGNNTLSGWGSCLNDTMELGGGGGAGGGTPPGGPAQEGRRGLVVILY